MLLGKPGPRLPSCQESHLGSPWLGPGRTLVHAMVKVCTCHGRCGHAVVGARACHGRGVCGVEDPSFLLPLPKN